jgi:hypothetical protein
MCTPSSLSWGWKHPRLPYRNLGFICAFLLETEMEPARYAMLDLLLNHSATFLVCELMLVLSLGLFGAALAGTVRERYATRVHWRDLTQRVVPSKLAYKRRESTPAHS